MARHGRVSVYRRDSKGKYHWCDPRGNYALGTTFVLRYEREKGRRVYDTLLKGTNHTSARRLAAERELELFSPPVPKAPVQPKAVPGFTRIRDAADKYLDALWAEGNLTPKTIKGKKFELYRWMGWTTKQYIEELGRDDMIAFRDRLRAEGFADLDGRVQHDNCDHNVEAQPAKAGDRLAQARRLDRDSRQRAEAVHS